MSGRYVLPSFTERTSYGIKEMNPYNKLFEDRIIFIGAPIDDTVANDVMAQLLTLESLDPDQDVSLYINSPGGSFTAMTAIYDTMQYMRPEVHTVCIGEASSAAAVLLAAGAPGKRAALPHARVLLHQPHTEGGRGQGSDLEIHAREILRMRDLQEEILSRHTARGILEIRKDIERDRIFTAEQARTYGLVDDIYASRKRTLTPAR
ncbi:ATP-dependent Clp protease proteolytic subunit [Nonomuraea angiospora]|uniref:ATP-dependent Clp protease proteolytic subunit n=1 Tax=Nonomuraea angiospora TaxID=46172 RepID=UPI0034107970